MALEAGSCEIALDKSVTGTGLAKELAEYYVGGLSGYSQLNGHVGTQIRSGIKASSEGLAAVIINYLTANAEIVTTITPSDSGLQRDPASSDPTLAPSADKVLAGTLA